MARYFSGKRPIHEVSQTLENGRARIDCRIFEEWRDIDHSTTARCGFEGSCTVDKTVGLGEKAIHTLKGSIESAIGVTGLLDLKSQVEEAVGREVNWNTELRTTKTFPYKAPKCGRCTLTIYQLYRIYEFDYWRKKRFTWAQEAWDKKWFRTLTEPTNNHDAFPDFEQYDDTCGCTNKEDPPPHDGHLSFDFGHISFRVPYRLTGDGFQVQILDKVAQFTVPGRADLLRGLDHGLITTLSVSLIPEPLQFLGEISEGELEVRVQKYEDSNVERPPVIAYEMDMLIDIEKANFMVAHRPEPLEG